MRLRPIRFLIGLALVSIPISARGQDASVCRLIESDQARLSCFDAIVAAVAAQAAARDTTIKTGHVVMPSAPARYEAADMRNLVRSPAAYVNKPLLFKHARCTYADVNDYRCLLAGDEAVEIRSSIVVPPPVQTAVEARCDTLHHKQTWPCEGTIRVIPTAIKAGAGIGLVVEAPSISFDLTRR